MKVGRTEQWGAFSTTWGTAVAMETMRDGTRDQRPARDLLPCWELEAQLWQLLENRETTAGCLGGRRNRPRRPLLKLGQKTRSKNVLVSFHNYHLNSLYAKLVVKSSSNRNRPGMREKGNSAHPY